MTKYEEGFYSGVLACLAIVKLHDSEVMFSEIVNSLDETKLIKRAKQTGDEEWSGLVKYGFITDDTPANKE